MIALEKRKRDEKMNGKSNMKGKKLLIFQAAVLSLSLLLASVSVGGCLLGDLAKEFPDAPTWYLQMFVTFPVIGGMLANIIGGAMAAKVGKKNLCLLGISMCFIGGFFPMFVPTLGLKIAIRVIASLGVGLIQPLSASLIVDCFEGKTANMMMGLQSSCVGLGASIFSYTMAAIMVYDWHFAYCTYLYAVAIFLLVLFGIPAFVNDIGREKKSETGDVVRTRAKLPKIAYVGFFLQLIYCLGYCAIDNCLSLASVETGKITTIQAASIASWGGIASLIGGLFFGLVKNKIGMKVGPLALVLNIIGLVIIGITNTTVMWYVGVTLLKVGFCWWMPFINFFVNEGTDESNSALATSLGFVGNSLGAFTFGYVLAGVGTFVGGISSHQAFTYGAIIEILVLIILLVYNFLNRKKTIVA